jgi:hypothetical protein
MRVVRSQLLPWRVRCSSTRREALRTRGSSSPLPLLRILRRSRRSSAPSTSSGIRAGAADFACGRGAYDSKSPIKTGCQAGTRRPVVVFLSPPATPAVWSRIVCRTSVRHSPIRGQFAPCFHTGSTAPYEPQSSKLTDLARVTCSLSRLVQWAARPPPRPLLSVKPLCGDTGVRSCGETALPQLPRGLYQSRPAAVTWQT